MPDLTGHLDDFALSELISLLGKGNKTGVLRIEGAIGEGTLNFNEGKLIYQGEPATAFEALTNVIVDLARLPNATFAFEAGVVSVGGPESLYDIEVVLAELSERLAAWSEVEDRIGSALQPYVVAATADEDDPLGISGADWNLLANLGDGSSAAGLARRTDRDEFDIAVALGRFLDAGLISTMEDQQVGAGSEPLYSDGETLSEPSRSSTALPAPGPEVFLDLTGKRSGASDPAKPPLATPDEEKPASDLAARWRDLRASKR